MCAFLSCESSPFFISENFPTLCHLIFSLLYALSISETQIIFFQSISFVFHIMVSFYFNLFPPSPPLLWFFYFRNLMFSWAYSLCNFICSVACYFDRMVFCQIISHYGSCLTWESLSRISNYSYKVCQNFQFYVTPSPDYQRTDSLLWLQQL